MLKLVAMGIDAIIQPKTHHKSEILAAVASRCPFEVVAVRRLWRGEAPINFLNIAIAPFEKERLQLKRRILDFFELEFSGSAGADDLES